MYLVNAQQMREIDRFAIEEIGIPGIVLMEAAGQASVREIEQRWSKINSVVIVAGHGNNGGDALVVARHLGNKGYDVKTWLVGQKEKLTSDSSITYHALTHSGYSVEIFEEGKSNLLFEDLENTELIVDGLLGTGLQGAIREPLQTIIRFINNQARSSVISLDIPSGVNADSGEVIGEAIQADVTVSFAFPKWGHYLFPGAGLCGELIISDISIPPLIANQFQLSAHLLQQDMIGSLIPQRKRHSHKGTYGHVLIIGGSQAYIGAPALAAMAAVRSGSGMVTLAIPESIQYSVAGQVPEAVFWIWPDSGGQFSQHSWLELDKANAGFDFTVVGPGMAQNAGVEWLREVVARAPGRLLLDADALNLLAKDLTILRDKPSAILTPHPGEMARLLNMSVKDVEKNRPQVAKRFAVDYQVYVVLKGTYPIIATPEGELYVSPRGSSSLAKGGSGDVLSGLIASFVNQTNSLLQGLLLAVYIHGMAGESMDEYSGAASDLGKWIGKAIQELSSSASDA